ncbi:Pectinesterase [Quillaja saponaria]|uniref:Pectinesterase n=1 Tax=Quillaja saponaria TaxID=32244 RepID=A0AAD7Q1W5_QUISA|nr:Pectinesterase [Quillaja saponaria]
MGMAMPSKLLKTSCITFLLILFSTPASPATSPDSICSLTSYPSFCKTNLPPNGTGNIYDFGLSFINKSLSSSMEVHSLILGYHQSQSSLSESTILALEDCQLLCELSEDFLFKTLQTINSTNSLNSSQVDDLQTLLSAALTNQQTCLDGLQEVQSNSNTTIKDDLLPLLSNGSMFYSISLALFKKSWGMKTKKDRKLTVNIGGRNEHLPLRFPSWEQKLREFITGRKLLQSVPNNVFVSQMVVVNPDGGGNFTTINDAVAATPNNTSGSNGYFVIYVVAGVYQEYVSIPKNKQYLMMIGDGINQTVITGNRSVGDGWTTFNSATFAVVAQGFVAVNITFQNTAGAIKHQAVALRSGADFSSFYSCSFEGYQDTLYPHSLRQFYKNCDIYGTVDFIFGNAAVVFQDCNIYPRLPLQGQFNAITAQGKTDINQNTGTSIQNCSIMAASDLANSNGTTKTYLGRPWKEYSRTVYLQTFMDSLIDSTGWREWSSSFALSTLYYAEYANWGPGSDTSNRVTWTGYHVINATDAVIFTVSNFITGDAWLPATGVPYFGGLL